jgi:hypothetical protein
MITPRDGSSFVYERTKELDYNDITYNIPHALIFGALEPSVGIVLSCLPLLRPLLGRSKYSRDGTAGSAAHTTYPAIQSPAVMR